MFLQLILETMKCLCHSNFCRYFIPNLAFWKWHSFHVHYIFTICSLYVHYIFTICPLYIHHMFTVCSLYIHHMFTICSPYVHYIFTICSLYVHYIFTICSLCIHHMFTICSLYIHHMFTICSLYIHHMFTIYSPYVHYMFTIYSPYVHHMFTICSLYIHHMFTIYTLIPWIPMFHYILNIKMTCWIRFCHLFLSHFIIHSLWTDFEKFFPYREKFTRLRTQFFLLIWRKSPDRVKISESEVCALLFNPNLYWVFWLPILYGGGQKSPRSNSGIWLPIVIKVGIIILWGINFSSLAKYFMTSWPLSKYDVISDYRFVATAKNVCNL